MPIFPNDENAQQQTETVEETVNKTQEGTTTPKRSRRSFKEQRARTVVNIGKTSKELKEFLETYKETLETSDEEATIMLLSKEVYTNLSYDFLLTAYKGPENSIYYSLILFAITGPGGISPTEYLTNLFGPEYDARSTRKGDQQYGVIIPGISINEHVEALAAQLLQSKYNIDKDKIVPIDGIVIYPEVDLKDPDLAALLAKEINAILQTRIDVDSGVYSDIAFWEEYSTYAPAEVDSNGNPLPKPFIRMSEGALTEDSVSITGAHRHTTYAVRITESTRKEHKLIPNAGVGDVTLAVPRGYVSPIYYDTINNRGEKESGFYPNVILNVIDTENAIPTIGAALLQLYGASLMCRDYRWVEPLVANADKPGRNPGVINKLNEEIDKKGRPVPAPEIDLSNLGKDERVDIVLELMSGGDPVVAMDAPAFDVGAAIVEAFKYAAQGNEDAQAAICKSMNEMSGGVFPIDFYKETEMFYQVVELPDGHYTNPKTKETEPTDNLDIMRILSIPTGKVKGDANLYRELAREYEYAIMDAGDESLELMLEVYEQLDELLNLNIVITGVKSRLYFTADFIEAITLAFEGDREKGVKGSGIKFVVESVGLRGLVSKNFGFAYDLSKAAGVRLRSAGRPVPHFRRRR